MNFHFFGKTKPRGKTLKLPKTASDQIWKHAIQPETVEKIFRMVPRKTFEKSMTKCRGKYFSG